MIEMVNITNEINDSLDLILTDPYQSGIAITGIDGIGASKATVNTREGASFDGSLFNSAKLDERNIVLNLQIVGVDVEEIRNKIYRLCTPKKQITVTIKTDLKTCAIDGIVESCEPDIFSQNETVQVSIICPQPLFRRVDANGKQTESFSSLISLFEFPFEGSFEVDNINLGEIEKFISKTVYYNGEEDTGMIINVHALAPVSLLEIYNINTREKISIDMNKLEQFTGSGLKTGDDIIINTNRGNRYIHLLREGKTYNILSCANKDLSWFQLKKGDNIFTYITNDEESFKLYLTMSYEEKYIGV